MRPIIFSTEMVRAILEGKKTQTRRVMKPQPQFDSKYKFYRFKKHPLSMSQCPYGQVGDRLWVRETFFYEWPDEDAPENMQDCRLVYRATEPDYIDDLMREQSSQYRWSPSIHMPQWASRITLELTDVRVGELKYMSESDAHAEGVDNLVTFSPMLLWDKLNKKRGYEWKQNCWVWVLEFKQVEESV